MIFGLKTCSAMSITTMVGMLGMCGALLIGCGVAAIGEGKGPGGGLGLDLTFCENPEAPAPHCLLAGFDVREKLETCAGTGVGCHTGLTPQFGFEIDLSDPMDTVEDVLSAYVDQAATVCSDDLLIDLGDPDCSFMLTKLTPKPKCGQRMPVDQSDHFSEDELQCFRKWLHDTYGP